VRGAAKQMGAVVVAQGQLEHQSSPAARPAALKQAQRRGCSFPVLCTTASASCSCMLFYRPFSLPQVTLFRVHKHFITPEAHAYRQKYKLGDSAGWWDGCGA